MMKVYINSVKLFCKSINIIVGYIILLGISNTILYLTLTAFLKNKREWPDAPADPIMFYLDIRMICFLTMVFFVFIAYEFIRKSKEMFLEETITATGVRSGLVWLSQLFVLLTAVIIFILNISIYLLIAYYQLQPPQIFLNEVIKIIFIDFMLSSIASIFIGCLISKISNRFIGYAIILGLVFMVVPVTATMFREWYFDFHIPIYFIRDFVYLLPPDMMAVYDPLYGLPFESYRVFLSFFWIFTGMLVFVLGVFITKRKTRAWLCVSLLITILFMGYRVINKGNVLLMHEHPESAGEESNYYHNNTPKESEVDFIITDYDMEFSMSNQLSAVVTMNVIADKKMSNYKFTLYHRYKVVSIVDQSGSKLSFQQDGDYIDVKNPSKKEISNLTFTYSGYSNLFYANKNACFLPGFFPYYPKAGYRIVYENEKGYFIGGKDIQANFNVKVNNKENIVSNLNGKDGIYQGSAENLLLIRGNLEEVQIDQHRAVCFPFQKYSYEKVQELFSEEKEKEIEEFKKFLNTDKDLSITNKAIFNIPSSLSMNSNLASSYVFNDYILMEGDYDLTYKLLEQNSKIENKELMKKVFFNCKVDQNTDISMLIDYKDMLGKNESYEEVYGKDLAKDYKLNDLFVLKMRELGTKKVVQKVYEYLQDKEDNTDSFVFLQNLK